MADTSCKLVFVYNADASFSSLLTEAAHKLFSPETFECNLCELTYTYAWKKKSWVEFLRQLPFEHRFYLRDRFLKKYPARSQDTFPCVYAQHPNGQWEILVGAEQMNTATTLEELKALVQTAVSQRL